MTQENTRDPPSSEPPAKKGDDDRRQKDARATDATDRPTRERTEGEGEIDRLRRRASSFVPSRGVERRRTE